jgi:hypothetical protein
VFLIAFSAQDDPLWLKRAVEINTTGNTVVLAVLNSVTLQFAPNRKLLLLLFHFLLTKLSVPETSVLQGYETVSMGSQIHDVLILKG